MAKVKEQLDLTVGQVMPPGNYVGHVIHLNGRIYEIVQHTRTQIVLGPPSLRARFKDWVYRLIARFPGYRKWRANRG